MRQAGEPSVEEILDSIKKVIARDNRAGADAERRHRESHGVVAATTEHHEEQLINGRHEVLDLSEVEHFDDDDYQLAEEAEADEIAPLITEQARDSMRDSLAALAMMSEPGVQPQIVRSGETSLEEMTRDLLRPALAEWLDRNLPPMVERLVAQEIARIVGKRG